MGLRLIPKQQGRQPEAGGGGAGRKLPLSGSLISSVSQTLNLRASVPESRQGACIFHRRAEKGLVSPTWCQPSSLAPLTSVSCLDSALCVGALSDLHWIFSRGLNRSCRGKPTLLSWLPEPIHPVPGRMLSAWHSSRILATGPHPLWGPHGPPELKLLCVQKAEPSIIKGFSLEAQRKGKMTLASPYGRTHGRS